MTELNVEKQNSLQLIVQTWKDQIICFSPQGEGYNAYFIDPRDGTHVNYIHASCDELRHLGTNYNAILNRIKDRYYGYLKEAILNTVKYEATRRVVRRQHQWIQSSYQSSIAQKEHSAEQQALEIAQLRQIIESQSQTTAVAQGSFPGQSAIQEEALLKQREAEIARQNSEIARLNQQLQQCDREINSLKSELNQGLQELKQKYKGLITQFVSSSANKHQIDRKNKSLQACKNIFVKAQQKINARQQEEGALEQHHNDLKGKVKMLRI
ncbi:MAG: hypothetical protein AAFQ41_15480 [Cyanobacteria bacterium J06623_7]